jgi:hypothetical protein
MFQADSLEADEAEAFREAKLLLVCSNHFSTKRVRFDQELTWGALLPAGTCVEARWTIAVCLL